MNIRKAKSIISKIKKIKPDRHISIKQTVNDMSHLDDYLITFRLYIAAKGNDSSLSCDVNSLEEIEEWCNNNLEDYK